MNFFDELRRRNVFRVAGVYGVVGWLIIQLGMALEETLNLPPWFDTMLSVLVLIGFPLALIFAWAFELTPDGMKRTIEVDPAESITHQTSRKLDVAILGGLALVASLVGFQLLRAPSPELVQGQASEIPEASIAVLPFADLSADRSQEYFGDGIAEELLNTLAKIDNMQVAGRTSSFAFKDKNEDLRRIGEVLNVAHILEGSIRKSGKTIRVTAQLIKVDDGFHLWSETYDRELKDIFAVQDEISREITAALMPHLVGEDAPVVPSAAPTDFSAYENFLLARDLVRSRETAKLEQARDLLASIVSADAGYAPAYALQAKATLLLSDHFASYGSIPVADAVREANGLIEQALAIEPNLGSAHAARGLAYANVGDSDRAIAEFNRAIELSPNDLDALNWLALELPGAHRHKEMAELSLRIFELDPLFPPAGGNAVWALYRVGDLERAETIVERAENISPVSAPTLTAKNFLLLAQGNLGASASITRSQYAQDPSVATATEVANRFVFALSDYSAVEPIEAPPYFGAMGALVEGNVGVALARFESLLSASPGNQLLRNEYPMFLLWGGRAGDIVPFFERTWGSLAEFRSSTTNLYGEIYGNYGELAFAFRESGQTDLFDDTMRLWRRLIDLDTAGGRKTLGEENARWLVMSGDEAGALSSLEQEFEELTYIPMWRFDDPLLGPLRNNPRFQALRVKALEKINRERAIADLPPLDA